MEHVQDSDDVLKLDTRDVSSRHHASDSPSWAWLTVFYYPGRRMSTPNITLSVFVNSAKSPYLKNIVKSADGDPSRLQGKDRLEARFAAQEKAKVSPGGASGLIQGRIDAVLSAGAQRQADSSDVHPISEPVCAVSHLPQS